jgi:hypothetical protein
MGMAYGKSRGYVEFEGGCVVMFHRSGSAHFALPILATHFATPILAKQRTLRTLRSSRLVDRARQPMDSSSAGIYMHLKAAAATLLLQTVAMSTQREHRVRAGAKPINRPRPSLQVISPVR